jgi:hypothetical protein
VKVFRRIHRGEIQRKQEEVKVYNMIRRLNRLRATVADYTVGSVIVMVHMLTAERRVGDAISAANR